VTNTDGVVVDGTTTGTGGSVTVEGTETTQVTDENEK